MPDIYLNELKPKYNQGYIIYVKINENINKITNIINKKYLNKKIK